MSENPLKKLESFGQSIWMDFIRRNSLETGQLKGWIEEDGVSGVTSNPSIFDKAIAGSHDYDDQIEELAKGGANEREIYEEVVTKDIQMAADLFRPTYDRLEGKDGFVSVEVSPGLAHDTQGSIEEARKWWNAVNRPNVMIKVPGTAEGIPAIRQLISEGINVNITLLFGLPRYREVIEAYLSGLEERASKGQSIDRIASVASFFLSRIDTLVDPMIEKIEHENWSEADRARKAHGMVAIASARVAYQIFLEEFQKERFKKLVQKGALTQRLLWASTSTKNPAYSDVKYVEALIGPDTINTVPVETLNAYRDHGKPAPCLTEDVEEARQVLRSLVRMDIDLDQVTQQLEDEGVQKFIDSYSQLMTSIQQKREAALEPGVNQQTLFLGKLEKAAKDWLDDLAQRKFIEGVWRHDASIWKEDPKSQENIRNSLGWLHVAEKMDEQVNDLESFASEVLESGFKHVVHMGMGGSSLAPMVLAQTFGTGSRGLPVTVLDTTDPVEIEKLTEDLPIAETLYIVASKSGTTAEPSAFDDYFYNQVKAIKGERAGENFVAITDPGTPLVQSAQERKFRRIFLNFADIGGRYSALSYFGMVPAALQGMDIKELLSRALRMEQACNDSVPEKQNPGLVMGSVLGAAAVNGRNKVTFVLPPQIGTFAMWLEQLLAESTGKEGTGLIPIAGEPLGEPLVYENDRIFVYITLKNARNENIENSLAELMRVGHPIVRIELEDTLDLGQEFFRWEMATSVAGAVLGINPFDQPNVQESKDNTNRLLETVEKEGSLPKQEAQLKEGNLQLFARENAATIQETIRVILDKMQPGGYIALLAYITENSPNTEALQGLRTWLRGQTTKATMAESGPRYLHSTGQMFKGGPKDGVFILFTQDSSVEVPIPGRKYTFEEFFKAQAIGDYQALLKHDRKVIRINLGNEPAKGLDEIHRMLM
jgi:transaldolase/glucose-6-phosphate isomerase